jgi:hypothetical protein
LIQKDTVLTKKANAKTSNPDTQKSLGEFRHERYNED